MTITKSNSWQMFNQISPKYDLLNHLLSFGLDIHWRNCLINRLPDRTQMHVLDLATGTADVLLTLIKSENVEKGTGIDMAENMLEIGRQKIEQRGLKTSIHLAHGDATELEFNENAFDVATMSFGIRNTENPQKVISEIKRVLKPGGRGLILEFSLPENGLIRALHVFYLRYFVPLIGWLFSGHYAAYKYLNRTIEDFPYGQAFCQIMEDSGLINVKAYPLLFGVATIYQGDKA